MSSNLNLAASLPGEAQKMPNRQDRVRYINYAPEAELSDSAIYARRGDGDLELIATFHGDGDAGAIVCLTDAENPEPTEFQIAMSCAQHLAKVRRTEEFWVITQESSNDGFPSIMKMAEGE